MQNTFFSAGFRSCRSALEAWGRYWYFFGHLTLCFLAYLWEVHLTKALRESEQKLESKSINNKIIKRRQLTFVQAMNELNDVMAIPVNNHLGKNRYTFQFNAQKLLTIIGLCTPPKKFCWQTWEK